MVDAMMAKVSVGVFVGWLLNKSMNQVLISRSFPQLKTLNVSHLSYHNLNSRNPHPPPFIHIYSTNSNAKTGLISLKQSSLNYLASRISSTQNAILYIRLFNPFAFSSGRRLPSTEPSSNRPHTHTKTRPQKSQQCSVFIFYT